ncbi:hypothetical protein XH79_34580 [Bradyrhizobium sp. CCBAU 45389]|nr:hypothetical protein [Bradyrhizobium sp. CCBAU 45389]
MAVPGDVDVAALLREQPQRHEQRAIGGEEHEQQTQSEARMHTGLHRTVTLIAGEIERQRDRTERHVKARVDQREQQVGQHAGRTGDRAAHCDRVLGGVTLVLPDLPVVIQ